MFCTDYLTKKMKVNEGEVPQYYVENSHPAILSAELFDYVQQELKSRKVAGYSSSSNPFANRIICGDCGRFFGQKLWHSTSKYRRTVWQCNWKFKNEKECTTPHLNQTEIEQAFVAAFNATLENKDEIIDGYERIISGITDCSQLEVQVREIDADCAILETVIEKFIRENARTTMNQEDYNLRYNELASRYDALRIRRSELNSAITKRKTKRSAIRAYLQTLKKQKTVLTAFDPDLWRSVVDKMVVLSGRQVVFYFKDGSQIQWEM